MAVAMMRGALVWLELCICTRSWISGRRIRRCSKKCNGSKRGTQFHGGSKARGLHIGSKGDGQGSFGLGLQ